jgi:hypothetical protein
VPVLLVGVLLLAVAIGLGAERRVPDLPPPPPTARGDLHLDVEAEREGSTVEVRLTVGVETGAEPLPVTHWTTRDEEWSSAVGGPGDRRRVGTWQPSVHAQRLARGQLVLHVGAPAPPMDDGIDRVGAVSGYQAPEARTRTIDAGQEVWAHVGFDPVTMHPVEGDPFTPDAAGVADLADVDVGALDEVRVCVWAAGSDPPPGGRPSACADADL